MEEILHQLVDGLSHMHSLKCFIVTNSYQPMHDSSIHCLTKNGRNHIPIYIQINQLSLKLVIFLIYFPIHISPVKLENWWIFP